MQSTVETWRPVVNYEDRYEVSSLGRVRSLYKFRVGQIITQRKNLNGYWTVELWRGGESKKFALVSRLVAMAFLGPGASNEIVLHGPAGKEDNSLANVSWGTYRQNAIDRARDNTLYSGSLHWKNKLTERQVEKIFDFYLIGWDKRWIADQLSVTYQNVHAVLIGKTWKHIYAQKMKVELSEVYDMWGGGQKLASIRSLDHLKDLLNCSKVVVE